MSIHQLGSGELANDLGGKASAWVRLHAAGLAVPDGFCIPAGEPVDTQAIGVALTALFARSGVSALAVRSSGIGEDGVDSALAGLFESFLDVEPTAEAVAEAAERCRAAGRGARATAALGRAADVGVLVQQMVVPTRSGVMFTHDPVSGSVGAVVDVVEGHLRHLVDGTADATRVRLGDATGGFTSGECAALRDLAAGVERVLRSPADIEWASVDGTIVLLQARPITGLGVPVPAGLTLVPVDGSAAARLPKAVLRHDKLELRLLAARLGIGISAGFVGLANCATASDRDLAAAALADWGEFIAVLLEPFALDGGIHRRFGTGTTAAADLRKFCGPVETRHPSFAFLLKELQETAMTGVAVAVDGGGVRVEVIHGHFITKGFEDPRVYELDAVGEVIRTVPGLQTIAVELVGGQTRRVQVSTPASLNAEQLREVRRATTLLAKDHPGAGIEFGYTPDGQFFLVDLYKSAAVVPPTRADVLSEGVVAGRVRVVEVQPDAVEASIERHIHSRPTSVGDSAMEPEILVVSRPFHVLDQLIYAAHPGALGFICEGGALLCHLAVVMRERGVPGLLLPNATRDFVDGEWVTLDTRPGSATTITRR